MSATTASESAQRPPALARDKADTLLLLASCTLVLAPHAAHQPWWITALVLLLLAWRGSITWRGVRLPPRWLLLPLALLAMAGIYGHYRTLLGRDAGVAMLVLLLSFKLLEMHARRDVFVVLYLSLFLLLTSFFHAQSIFSGLWMMLTVVLLLTAQLSFQYTGRVPPLRQRLRSALLICALAAPLALALFLLFPRVPGPLWGLPGDATGARSGLSNRMTPGAIAQLALSDDIAFRVRFDGAAPAQSLLYWRGPVLGHYDGRSWSEVESPLGTRQPQLLRTHGKPLHYQVTLEPHGQQWLFVLPVPASVPQLADNPVRLGAAGQLLAARPISQRVRYDASSYPDFSWEPVASPLLLQSWLQLPAESNPRSQRFARQIQQRYHSDEARAQAVLSYFRDQGFRYTLEPPLLGADGVDEFLFSTRAGFCEHYAGAFVLLMRAMEIPARVVTGYQGGTINPVDGLMTIRQSDAHAWAEIWLEQRGWTRVDPTAAVAPNRIELNLASVLPAPLLGGLLRLDRNSAWVAPWLSPWQRLRANWDAASNAWNQWVLNYGTQTQYRLLRALGVGAPDWQTLVALLAGVGALLLLPASLLWRRQRQTGDAIDRLYCTLSRRLARHGLARQPCEGPRAYRQRLLASSTLSASSKSAASAFLQLLETERYRAPAPGLPTITSRRATRARLTTLLKQCH